MTIHLPPEVEKSLIAKVHSGMFPSLDAAMTKAAHLLLEQIEQAPAKPIKTRPKATKTSLQVKQPLSPEELNQQLLASGFLSQLPDPSQDIDDDDDLPIVIKGEPLSETIIRERR